MSLISSNWKGVLVGLLLAVGLFFVVDYTRLVIARAEAGAAAYGWLGSAVAPGSNVNRAKFLEDFIKAELAKAPAK
jgi:hypothetical protein